MRRPATVELMLLATIVLWALNFTVTKYVLEHGFEPLAYSTTRYGVAALLFAAFTFGVERSLRVTRRDVLLVLGAAGVGIWLNQLSYVYALKFTTASTTALILGVTPIFTALIASAIGLERVSRRFWIAAAVSFCGVVLVAAGGHGALSGNLKGYALGVATAATWAGYTIVVAPLMRRYSPYRISALVLLLGAAAVAITGSHQLATQDWSLDGAVWLLLVYATLGPLVITNILWFRSVHRVGPSRATLFANLQPFLAALFAVVLLSEQITLLQIAGGAAIAAGIAIARRRRPPAPAAE
jgi:drug/metabolite transporter (DMT)-like permease